MSSIPSVAYVAEANHSRIQYNGKSAPTIQGVLGVDLGGGYFGMFPKSYHFALISTLSKAELAIMHVVLRMTYESMHTEWYFTGALMKEFSKQHTPKVNNRHTLPTGHDAVGSSLGTMRTLSEKGYFFVEDLQHTSGNKKVHKVTIDARTITLLGLIDMKQIDNGYIFLSGRINDAGLFADEKRDIGITDYNKELRKVMAERHKKRGVFERKNKSPSPLGEKKYLTTRSFSTQSPSLLGVFQPKIPYHKDFFNTVCDENGTPRTLRVYKNYKRESFILDGNNPDNLQLDTNTHYETKAGVIIPPELDLTAWVEYVAHRIDIKKKMSPKAQTLMIKKLVAYPKSTQDEAIKNSIMNGWVGVFPESIKIDRPKQEVLI